MKILTVVPYGCFDLPLSFPLTLSRTYLFLSLSHLKNNNNNDNTKTHTCVPHKLKRYTTQGCDHGTSRVSLVVVFGRIHIYSISYKFLVSLQQSKLLPTMDSSSVSLAQVHCNTRFNIADITQISCYQNKVLLACIIITVFK
jgi:hypothetical protein